MAGSANSLGGYEIVREIARSNDIVYEARDPAMNRRIALKELALPPNLVGQQRRERIERFYREARAAGNLSHPNIVTIFKVGEENGRHFIAMEFLEGETLRGVLQIAGPLPIHRALEIVGQVCDALDFAHSHGVVHRDIKPDNIQILPDGTAKITDFGIARMGSEPGITQAGQVFGTPSYMSPEQIAGKSVDQRSDIFSLGVVLYEVLTGRKPFTGDSIVTITYNIMNMEPAPPPGVAPHLQQIIRRAMAKVPEQRFQSAREMAAALRTPARPAAPFADTQHVTSLPRVTSLPVPNAVAASFQASPDPPAPPGSQWTGSPGYAPPQPMASPPVQTAASFLPPGYAPPQLQAAPSLPPLPTAPGAPALPPPLPPIGAGVRQFLAKNLTLLTLLSLVTAFVLIAVGVFWALKAGYEGYQNANTDQELIAKNNQAVDMLNRGDYQDAYPSLAALSQQVKPGSPLYDKVQHNLGSCWFEAGQAAQGRGDLTEARNDYEKALPLLPERQMEINQDLEAVQMGAGGTPAPAPATSSPAPTPADPGAGAQPGTPTSPGSNVGTTPTPAAPVGNGGSAPSTTAPGVAGGSTPAGGTTPPSSPLSPPPGSAAPTRTEENIQSRNEYNAAQRAQRNGDPAGAREHYEKSVNLDPGAGWARDAQHQLDTLSP